MSSSGPFGKREDETEYALMIGGVIVTDDDSQPVVFATKREAYAYALRRFPMAMPDYLHRRVTPRPLGTRGSFRDAHRGGGRGGGAVVAHRPWWQ